jgi:hypothetical protein
MFLAPDSKRAAAVMVLAVALAAPCARSQPSRARQVRPADQPNAIEPSGRRAALVIGNNQYQSLAGLVNAVNDARSVRDAIRSARFEVVELEDQGYEEMQRGVDRFASSLARGDVALFYYSGHGMQIGGENFLVPVDLDVDSDEIRIRARSVNANETLERLEKSETVLNILILDACRTNPVRRGRGAGAAGWASMNVSAAGTYMAFATAPNATASDGGGSNGLFTTYLVDAMRQPGLELDGVFRLVRQQVITASNRRQVPWSSSSLIGEFYFLGNAPSLARPMQFPQAEPPPPNVRPGSLFGTQYQEIVALNGKSPGEIAALAQKGDGYANYLVGLFQGPEGRKARHPEVAFRYFQKAADSGVLLAMRKLGNYYEIGKGVNQSAQSAMNWYERAAQGGDFVAMYLAGMLYETGGADLAPDLKRAIEWYRTAGRAGFGDASDRLMKLGVEQ